MNFIMFVFDGVDVGTIFYNTGNYIGTFLTESQTLVLIAFIFFR